ncbi:polygalacturonase inhibitor-like [Salvia miltiorrhiza]|uniref:polygalacturonase inhibitor-like n=1 Tax=Salvia miltiorrhiza TaxID=226208 RepID=UPI0025ABD355|nr:polygalacturonase inhibitor-like [Salvia miltiorrhiza]
MKLSLLPINIVSLLITIILSQSPVSLSETERCNPQDKQALLNIKKAFNNAYHFASWRPDTDCCDWYIVMCDRHTNRIISLDIFAANLSGTIPDAVADLPSLKTLTFHKITNLSGTIPVALTKLTNLEMLTISWTDISGAIPVGKYTQILPPIIKSKAISKI